MTSVNNNNWAAAALVCRYILWTIFARQKAATSRRLYLYKRATKTAAAAAASAERLQQRWFKHIHANHTH